MATYSSTFAWKIPWKEEPGRLQSMGSLESDTTEQLHFHFSLSCIGEGNGNPLQCSCLENPRDGGAWWAAISGVTQSRTRLKRLSSSSGIYSWHKLFIRYMLYKYILPVYDLSFHSLNGHEFGQTQEDMKDRGAWHASVHGITKSRTWLRDWTTTAVSFEEQTALILRNSGVSICSSTDMPKITKFFSCFLLGIP